MEPYKYRRFLVDLLLDEYKISGRKRQYIEKLADRVASSKANRLQKTTILHCLIRLIPFLDEKPIITKTFVSY